MALEILGSTTTRDGALAVQLPIGDLAVHRAGELVALLRLQINACSARGAKVRFFRDVGALPNLSAFLATGVTALAHRLPGRVFTVLGAREVVADAFFGNVRAGSTVRVAGSAIAGHRDFGGSAAISGAFRFR